MICDSWFHNRRQNSEHHKTTRNYKNMFGHWKIKEKLQPLGKKLLRQFRVKQHQFSANAA